MVKKQEKVLLQNRDLSNYLCRNGLDSNTKYLIRHTWTSKALRSNLSPYTNFLKSICFCLSSSHGLQICQWSWLCSTFCSLVCHKDSRYFMCSSSFRQYFILQTERKMREIPTNIHKCLFFFFILLSLSV